MQINVLVTGGLYSAQSAYSALQFCRAALGAGHTVSQVFFYQDGVSQASALSMSLADEFEPVQQWQEFSQASGCDLVVCVSAGERRGLISDAQAQEFGKTSHSLHPAFKVEGLGVLHDACLSAQRTVTFK